MANGNNQKLKLLYLAKIFREQTDENHGLTAKEIISQLNEYQVNAERKTLYWDFDELRHFGLDIVDEHYGHNVYYHLANREFELPELKLLVDSVQSSKFITEHKSQELIKKLETLGSIYDAKEFQRQVILTGRENSKELFGMYDAETVDVTLLCENALAGAIIDRFGKDIPINPVDADHFKTRVNVSANNQFLGWVFALGKGVKIISPESVVVAMKEEAKRLAEQYLD